MHALSFLQKRGHLSAVALGRKMFSRVPAMTPARFDLLHVIYENSRGRPGGDGNAQMSQALVRRRLGLARQTIWKMVKRLVELGLLEKWPHPEDRRRIALQLTPEGILRIREAYGAAFAERHVVSSEDGGMDAPRHVHRLVRREAKAEDHLAKWYPRKVLPFASPAERKAWWPSRAPTKVGREVAKVFTSFAFARAGKPERGRRIRTLSILQDMVRDARTIAKALGDQSDLIYSAPHSRPKGPESRTTIDTITWWLRPELAQHR